MEGRMPINQTIISEEFAQELGHSLEENITIEHFKINGLGYDIVNDSISIGNFHKRVLKYQIILPWELSQNLSNLEGKVNILYLQVDSTNIQEIKNKILDYPYVQFIESKNDSISGFNDAFAQILEILDLIQLLCFLLGLGVILLTSLITIGERQREIGTMATLGAPDWTIFKISLKEAQIMGLIGIFTGYLLGWVTLEYYLLPEILQVFKGFVIKTFIPWKSLAIVSVLAWIFAQIAQTPVLFSLKKMDLPKATKLRDF